MQRIINFIAAPSIQRLKLSWMECAACSALSDHISITTFTACTSVTAPERAVLQHSCRSCCCPQLLRIADLLGWLECFKESPAEVEQHLVMSGRVRDKPRSPHAPPLLVRAVLPQGCFRNWEAK